MFAKVSAAVTLPALLLGLSQAQQAPSAHQQAEEHAQRAQRYLGERDPQKAIPELEQVVALEPNNVQAQANLGVLLYFANNLSQAAPHLHAALVLEPHQPKLQMLLGSCEHNSGQLELARADLTAAFSALQDPKVRKQAGLEIVEVDTALNDLAAATSVVNQLKAAFPTDPEILFAAYRVYTDLAGESLLDLSVAAPDSAQLHQAMAHELIRQRDNDGAIANLRTALKLNPNLPGGHFELGELLSNSLKPEEKAAAEGEYKLALEQQPHDPAALTRLGDFAGARDDHEGAIARYHEALAAQPDFNNAMVGLAYQLTETGHPDQALPLLQKAIQADPSDVLAHYRLSAVYRRLHRPEDSKREVAEYERLKAMREKLRTVYDGLHTTAQQVPDGKP